MDTIYTALSVINLVGLILLLWHTLTLRERVVRMVKAVLEMDVQLVATQFNTVAHMLKDHRETLTPQEIEKAESAIGLLGQSLGLDDTDLTPGNLKV
jgi:hypothetical protein|tara:strand:+ start:4304 stop:4594 length:291 start_codon:yes stop_codon:yes gene_type:complete